MARAAKACGLAPNTSGAFLKNMARLILAYILLSLVIALGVLMQHRRELATVDIPHSLKPADYVMPEYSEPFTGFGDRTPYYSASRKGTAI